MPHVINEPTHSAAAASFSSSVVYSYLSDSQSMHLNTNAAYFQESNNNVDLSFDSDTLDDILSRHEYHRMGIDLDIFDDYLPPLPLRSDHRSDIITRNDTCHASSVVDTSEGQHHLHAKSGERSNYLIQLHKYIDKYSCLSYLLTDNVADIDIAKEEKFNLHIPKDDEEPKKKFMRNCEKSASILSMTE